MKTCSVEGCNNEAGPRGWCKRHYQLFRRHHLPEAFVPLPKITGCSVEGCLRPHLARGLCAPHYQRMVSKGNVEVEKPFRVIPDTGEPLDIRLENRINRNGPIPEFNPKLGRCWIWTGYIKKGRANYGSINLKVNGKDRNFPAHRVVYEFFVGPISEGLELDHLCRVHQCVNPKHLDPVTTKVNQHRGFGWAGNNHRKTHCPAGHPYDDEHTYKANEDSRRCRTCNAIAARRYRALKRAKKKEAICVAA